MKRRLAIGIDLGGTNIKGVLIREDGEILQQKRKAIEDNPLIEEGSPKHWKNAVLELSMELSESIKVETIGMSAPGLPDKHNEVIAFMPGRLSGIEDFHWGDFFAEKNVRVLNDAQAALLAECNLGAGKGMKNVLMITLGTGVGGGILIGGNIYQGYGQRAGHLGHIALDSTGVQGITGTPGSLEDAIGNSTVEKRSFGKYNSTAKLVEAYREGDIIATHVWLESIRKLAIGITSLINVISPELVILGGGISMAGDALFQPLREFLKIYEWRPGGLTTRIKPAVLNDYSGAVGAALYALRVDKKVYE